MQSDSLLERTLDHGEQMIPPDSPHGYRSQTNMPSQLRQRHAETTSVEAVCELLSNIADTHEKFLQQLAALHRDVVSLALAGAETWEP